MTTHNPIAELLTIPLGPEWTVEELAEKMLSTIANQPTGGECAMEEFVLDAQSINDRQTIRLIRPLLACLASKSAAEAGTSANLYEGRLSFKRPGQDGPVWIHGEFQNHPSTARVALRRNCVPSLSPDSHRREHSVNADDGPRNND